MLNASQDTGSVASLFSSINAGTGSSAKNSSAVETQNRFLKLLVTQMKNQDPLNPMDNAQVTSQMAQLSTVTGIDKLHVTLQAFSDSMTSNQSLQAASMIGRGVLMPGKGMDLINAKGYGGIDLNQSVDKLDIAVYDQSGALVRNINLGAQAAGLVNWQWDGRNNAGDSVADGSYTFTVNADVAGKKVDAMPMQFGIVSSVTLGSQGVELRVGQVNGVALSQVRQIF